MLPRLIAAALTAAALHGPALAGGPGHAPAMVDIGSISYIGFDRMGPDGLPVCESCKAEKAAEQENQREMLERRQRARAYMARMQGKTVPDDPTATDQPPQRDFDAAPPVRVVGEPWAAAQLDAPLRPSLK